MKHVFLFGRLLLLFVIGTILSCTDHRDIPAPALRFRVKTIAYGQSQPILLTYNAANQLSSYVYAGSTLQEMIRNKGIGYTDNHVGSMAGSINKNSYYWQRYFADTQGRIIKMEYYDVFTFSNGPNLVEEFTYSGNSTTPSSRTATREPGSPYSKSRTELYTFSGGNATSIDGTSYTYDTSPNPYKGLFGFSASAAFDLLGTTGDVYDINNPFSVSNRFSDMSAKVFNQNNITTDAQLTYNSNGLVTKIVYKDGNTESFTYEPY